MKKIILLAFMLSVVSCEIQYDAETKLVVETRLIDYLGNPISNQEISITARRDTRFLSNSRDLISNGKTNSQGESLLVFPAPKGEEVFLDILISENSFNYSSEYQEKRIYNLKVVDFKNYKLNLNPTRLFRKDQITQLVLTPNQINNNNILKNIRLEGIQPSESVIYNSFPNQQPSLQFQFSVLKNNIAIIKYDVLDTVTNITTAYTLNIPIATTQVNTVLNY